MQGVTRAIAADGELICVREEKGTRAPGKHKDGGRGGAVFPMCVCHNACHFETTAICRLSGRRN